MQYFNYLLCYLITLFSKFSIPEIIDYYFDIFIRERKNLIYKNIKSSLKDKKYSVLFRAKMRCSVKKQANIKSTLNAI